MSNVLKTVIWDKTGFNKLGKYLDLASYRHKLISGNIANAATPGYSSKDINFKEEVNAAIGKGSLLPMKTTSAGHLGNSGIDRDVKVIKHGAESPDDINGVDIDNEVTNMAVNQMRYTIGAQMLKRKVSALQKAITGR